MNRISKILCVAAIAFYCLLAALDNISDYYANFPVVAGALMMKDIYPDSLITYRAITQPVLHHLAFIMIMSCESLSGLLCAIGAWKLFRARKESAQIFNNEKSWAIAGLTGGFLTWQVLFMSVGGEWFGIWMSASLRGAISTAFQIFITILGVLIYLVLRDE